MTVQGRTRLGWTLLLAALIGASGGQTALAKPLVLVSISDMAGIVRSIAGESVILQTILPPGADPHSFSLAANQAARLRHASLIVYANSQAIQYEANLKRALPAIPSTDWPDYAAAGAHLKDFPGYPQSPHGAWLSLDNAPAIARALAPKLRLIGVPAAILANNLSLFEREIAAQKIMARRLAANSGLRHRPLVALVPGVCYTIDNLGLPVADVLMAEGSGTVAGPAMMDAATKLRSGAYAGLVCPLAMKAAKAGQAARQVARDTGAAVFYVHFLDLDPARDTFLSQSAYNIGSIAGGPVGGSLRPEASPVAAMAIRQRNAVIAIVALLILIFVLMRWFGAAFRIGTRRGKNLGGAGIFDNQPEVTREPSTRPKATPSDQQEQS